MTLEISDKERDLLLEVIEAEQRRFIHGLDHTDGRGYKAILKERLQTLEQLLAKVQSQTVV